MPLIVNGFEIVAPFENVFTPANDWAAVVTSPRAAVPAFGMLNVCVVPDEEIVKSVPVAPVASVCVALLRALRVVMPPDAGVCHDGTPPDMVSTCPLAPTVESPVPPRTVPSVPA